MFRLGFPFFSATNTLISRTPNEQRAHSPILHKFRERAKHGITAIVINSTIKIAEMTPYLEHLLRMKIQLIFNESPSQSILSINQYAPCSTIILSQQPDDIEEAIRLSCWTVYLQHNQQPLSDHEKNRANAAHYQINSPLGLINIVKDVKARMQAGEFPTSSIYSPSFKPSCIPDFIMDNNSPLVTLR